MARIAVPRTQPALQRIVPAPVHSRVVLMQLLVAAGVGNDDYAVTPPLGNRVRLLGVDVWIMPTSQGGFIEASLKVTAGSGERFTGLVVSEAWAPVMDVTMLLKVGILFYCCDNHFHFDMNKLYIGESQRFGMYSVSTSNTQYTILGGFHIAEG